VKHPLRTALASGGGSDPQSLLARAGADGFDLCGVALAETATPTLVAVMRRADTQLGVLDCASLNDVPLLGEYLSRLGNHRLTFASIRRGDRGGMVLRTALTRFSP
jgi:hypothetical protein